MTDIQIKIVGNCNSEFKYNSLKNNKHFLIFLFHFWNLHQILNHLKQKIIVIANVSQKLQTVKKLLRSFSKKPPFRTRFEYQHVKVSQILAKSQREHFYHVFSLFLESLIWKTSPLVLGEILESFVNTLIANHKYRVQDCENLPLPIQ